MTMCVYWHKGENGTPATENFRLEEATLSPDLQDGDVLVRTVNLSVDPYMVITLHYIAL